MTRTIDDVRIKEIKALVSPEELMRELPATGSVAELVYQSREAIRRIVQSQDSRLLVVVGPCSIHDPVAAVKYALEVKKWISRYEDDLCIVMRVYFEKPRTTVGWKGLINDPRLDDSFQIHQGLEVARKLLLDVAEAGVPAATEYLDMIIPQYIADLVSWAAIGARTTESQVHRELASGLSCPVGFKNGTDGNVKIAVDAVKTARQPHHFLSVTKSGQSAIVSTAGNEDGHVILRGGRAPNYDEESIEEATRQLAAVGLPAKVMIDCSHANSAKDYTKQRRVAESISQQIRDGAKGILGVMIESNLVEGRQELVPGKKPAFGQSITDACIGLPETEAVLDILAAAARTLPR